MKHEQSLTRLHCPRKIFQRSLEIRQILSIIAVRLRNIKFRPLYAALVGAGLMAMPAAYMSGQPVPPGGTNVLGPRLAFATNGYSFGRVFAGELVNYVFIVTNTGDQTLEISKVAPGCHCTTAGNWTHQVEPGKTGEIPIQLETGAFRGDVTKTIQVTSNDRLATNQTLTLRGTVWRLIEVSPERAYFNFTMGGPSNSTMVVHITNRTDQLVTLSDLTSATGSFKAELKTIKPGKEFEVVITAAAPLMPETIKGTISVKTSLSNMAVIKIGTLATLESVLRMGPAQIVLSPQISEGLTTLVKIIANGTNTFSLSVPEVSDKKVSVELKEITPRRFFLLTAAFPPGYQIAPGQKVQVSIKSDNAQQPVIIVPITQTQR
jgi:hypothetical protein